jgi:23S rRNA (cytosine1962-C5)-methyltransferase
MSEDPLRVVLKPGKERAIRNRHHWIFSGAVQTMPEFKDGDILAVYSADGRRLGSAYFNRRSNIIGRMVAFGDAPVQETITANIDAAIALRQAFFDPKITTGYRLINGEGDCLPGLVVDRYEDVLVIQISTLGMERMREQVINYLVDKLKPQAIYEKSLQSVRKEEGLSEKQGLVYGSYPALQAVPILENGLHFLVDIPSGQKTGFFLDHRKMRDHVRSLSKGKRVLNCFAYTGGFSVAALAGGAVKVDSIDISVGAIERARQNAEANGFEVDKHGFVVADAFQYLREKPLDYEIVILDPPAFAKRQQEVIGACRGYKEINKAAIAKMPSKSLLFTCSCSYHVDATLFQQVVFQAAAEVDRGVKIIGRHALAEDHPVNLFQPQVDYLKSLVLYIE